MRSLVTLMLLLGAFASNQANAQEANLTLHSTVSGSQEQPRVMYIVPWQQPGAAEFDFVLHNGIAEDLFTPLDRDEFLRGLTWHDQRREERLEAAAEQETYKNE